MDQYRELIGGLPLGTIEYAFAYGSGALQQKNENISEKMVDFIICSNDSQRFHTDNIERNPSHYSLMRLLGPKLVTNFQTSFGGARIYYNTHVKVGSRLIKYGVISTENLKQDLLDWRWLYVAGRLHKPVLEVIHPSEEVSNNVYENRRSALQAALLLLPDSFEISQLWETIVGLSYTGDFRMHIAEDKDKVKKIVQGCSDHINEVYQPLLDEDARIVMNNGKILQDVSGPAIFHRLNLLPSQVLQRVQKDFNRKTKRQQDCEEVIFSLAHRHDVASTVSRSISAIVAPAALSQTAKNAFSAGLGRSVVYSLAKITKMLKSR